MSSAEVTKIKPPIIKSLQNYYSLVSSLPFYVPQRYSREVDHGPSFPKTRKEYNLNIIQRIFVTLDYGLSSVLASLYSTFMVLLILMSVVVYILTTDGSVKYTPDSCDYPACQDDPDLCPGRTVCEPIDKEILNQLELFCLCVFLIDYGLRILLCPFVPGRLLAVMPHNWDQVTNVTGEKEDPEYTPIAKLFLYFMKGMNLIDLLAIVTGFIAYQSSNETGNSNGLAITRVLRLVRVFRIFRIGGMTSGVALFTGTIKRSLSAVRVMFFFSFLFVIIFGSIMYYVESGDFEVTNDYPDGQYLRWDYVRNQKEISPFASILTAMYWAIVTTTTVGYGDFYPTTGVGRFLGCVYMYLGIIMLALPISVVGTNFQREYELHYPDYIDKELKRNKQRAALGFSRPPTTSTRSRSTTSNPLRNDNSMEDDTNNVSVELTNIVKATSDDNDQQQNVKNDLNQKVLEMDIKLTCLIDEIRELKQELKLARGGSEQQEGNNNKKEAKHEEEEGSY